MRAKLGRWSSRVSNCWRRGRVRSLAEPVGPEWGKKIKRIFLFHDM